MRPWNHINSIFVILSLATVQAQVISLPDDSVNNVTGPQIPTKDEPVSPLQDSSLDILARSQNVDQNFGDFESYDNNDFHPIYNPILAAHLDDNPNLELNSILPKGIKEDPLLNETEEMNPSVSKSDNLVRDSSFPLPTTEQLSEEEGSPSIPLEYSQNLPQTESSEHIELNDEIEEELPTTPMDQPIEEPLDLSTEPVTEISLEMSTEQPLELSTEIPTQQLPEHSSTVLPKEDDERPLAAPSSQSESILPSISEKSEDEISRDSSLMSEAEDTIPSVPPSSSPELNQPTLQLGLDSTTCIYTSLLIVCMYLYLGRWSFTSSNNVTKSPPSPKCDTTRNLSELKSLQNLEKQANRLRIANRRLATRVKNRKKLEPIMNEIASLKERLGYDVRAKVVSRRRHLENLKNLLVLQGKQCENKHKIQLFKHEKLMMIRNFIELENLIDLLKDIEFQRLCNTHRESIFRTKVEVDFLKEQIDIFKSISKEFQVTYDQLSSEILQERNVEKIYDDELTKLRDSHTQLDENDSIDSWKSRIAEKITETDKLYGDYYYNYRCMNEFLQVS